MKALDNTPLRFAASLGVALCVVSLMLWFALEVSGFTEKGEGGGVTTHAVDLLSTAERAEIERLLAGDPHARVPSTEPRAIAPLDLGREVRGIVRLEVEIDATGEVADVRVIDAAPAGIYEAQAVADVRRREYAPEMVAGRAVPSRRLEIVDFTVTPAR